MTAPGVATFIGIGDKQKTEVYKGEVIGEDLVNWMNYATVPTYFEYIDDHSEVIFNHPTPIAFLLSGEKDQAY